MFRRAGRARRRTATGLLLPGRRHGRPGLRRPLLHRAACTTRSTTRSACARCARSSTTTCAGRPSDFALRRGRLRARRRRAAPPLAAQVAAAGRGRATRPPTGPGSAPTSGDDFPPSWPARPTAAGWTADGPGCCGSPPRAWPTPTRSARGCSPPPVRARDGRVRTVTRARDGPDDPLPGPAGELQLRLPVLPVRQAARQPGAAARRPGRAGAVRRLGRPRSPTRPALGAVHPVGRGAGPLLVPATRWSSCRHLPHVDRVAIQTNLSRRAGWLADADPDTLALWAPTTRARSPDDRFLGPVPRPGARGVRFSVGVVGLPEHLDDARRAARRPARRGLPVGQRRRGPHLHRRRGRPWTAIDPLFGYSGTRTAVAGLRLPHRRDASISVRRRRHGAPLPLRPGAAGQPLRRLVPGRAAAPRLPERASATATSATSTSSRSPLYDVFAGGVLERIPALFGSAVPEGRR